MQLIEIFQKEHPGIRAEAEAALAGHTSFQIGGPAELLVLPESEQEVCEVVDFTKRAGVRLTVLGNGSNLLVSDAGVRGVVLKTEAVRAIAAHGETLTAGAGAPLSRVCAAAQKNGLSGLEFAFGIPGSAGGAVYMNAGAYDREIAQLVSETRYLDSDCKAKTLSRHEHDFGYRQSVFKQNKSWIILQSSFVLVPDDPAVIGKRMWANAERRSAAQPLSMPSAGSIFKRPPGHFAGKLIQEAGLRGARVGGAQVSEKHAGFLVNMGGATCADVRALIALVQERVLRASGVSLECEVEYLE